MFREIERFHKDEMGDWVAELVCDHSQHVRHRPPFQSRPWVLDDEERASRVGTLLNCPLCDKCELPTGMVLKSTRGPWSEDTLPPGLRSSHKVAKGTWAILRVLRGSAKFSLQVVPVLRKELSAGQWQAIPPQIAHAVIPTPDGEILIEFWEKDGARDGPLE